MTDSTIETLIDHYCAAWNEPDAARMRALLAQALTADAIYVDPTVHTVGAEALVAHIGTVMLRFPGSRVVRTSVLDIHHDLVRFYWKRVLGDGSSRPEGIDICEVSDGKLTRILGFFGPLERF